MEEILREIRDDVKSLLVSDGRKHERIKSLEDSRRTALKIVIGVFLIIIAAGVGAAFSA